MKFDIIVPCKHINQRSHQLSHQFGEHKREDKHALGSAASDAL